MTSSSIPLKIYTKLENGEKISQSPDLNITENVYCVADN